MSASRTIERAEFEQLLAEEQDLVRLANELEYQLYRLRDVVGDERVTDCQQAGGALVDRLRNLLFRIDQELLPLLDTLTAPGEGHRTTDF